MAEAVALRGGILAGGGLRAVKPRTIKEGVARLTEQQRRGYMHHVTNRDHFMDEECAMCDSAGYLMTLRCADARHQALALAVRRFGRLAAAGGVLAAEIEAATPVPSERSLRAARKRQAFERAVLTQAARLAAAGRPVGSRALVEKVGGPYSRVVRAVSSLIESGCLEVRGGGCNRTYVVAGAESGGNGVQAGSRPGQRASTVR